MNFSSLLKKYPIQIYSATIELYALLLIIFGSLLCKEQLNTVSYMPEAIYSTFVIITTCIIGVVGIIVGIKKKPRLTSTFGFLLLANSIMSLIFSSLLFYNIGNDPEYRKSHKTPTVYIITMATLFCISGFYGFLGVAGVIVLRYRK